MIDDVQMKKMDWKLMAKSKKWKRYSKGRKRKTKL
jgi:hypothetical protein